MNKARNQLLVFIAGLIMLVCGIYWLTNSVTVTTGFYNWRIGNGNINTGGLVVVPLLAGVFWLFVKPKSMGAKILSVVGIVLVIASIIAATRFIFRERTLFEYLLMLVFICGGFGLSLRALIGHSKDE